MVVNTNPLYTATELEHQLKDSGAVAIVVLENFAATLEQALPDTGVRHVIVTAVGDLLQQPKGSIVNFVLRHVQRKVPRWLIPEARCIQARVGRRQRLDAVAHRARIMTIWPTCSTPAAPPASPKGRCSRHGNMVANVLQSRAWFQQVALDRMTFVCALPLYHIFSLTANCLLFGSLGGTGLLIVNPRDFKAFIAELRRHAPMFFMGVNTLFNALMHTPGFRSIDFSRLAATVAGGMALQSWRRRPMASSSRAARSRRAGASPRPHRWAAATSSRAADAEFNGSIGLPLPSTEITIRDDEGRDLGIGQVGEICLRGPQVMRGYWQRPEETAKVMLPEGWLRTGDIGRIDARGFVFIEDRKKDMIIVSGFKVYPNEVEDVVARRPGVLEVAAVAQPDEHSGEVVALFIVRKDPALTAQSVKDFAHQYLTGYKRPQAIYFRDQLPKTNVGKILRRELRDELAQAPTKAA